MTKKSIVTWLILSQLALVPTSWAAETENSLPEAVKSGEGSGLPASESNGETELKNQPATQEDIEGVRTEIETLREQWTRTYDNKTAKTTRPLQFSGIAQTRFTASEDKSATNGYGGFDISALILNFAGVLRRDDDEGKNISYLFSLVTPSGARDFTVRPLDAYISYSILPSNLRDQPYLTVSLGQQKKPFGLEALATEDKKPTIKSAQSASLLSLDPRDIGIVLKGDLFPNVDSGFGYRVPLIEYSLGVINGSGPNKWEDNQDKDFVGRVVLNAAVDYNSLLRGLSLGSNYYLGRKQVSLTTGTTTISDTGAQNRWGVDLAYVNTPVGFTLEYIRGEDAALSGTTASPVKDTIKSEGVTFTLFYNFGEQFIRSYKAQDRYDDWYPLTYQPFFRYDRFDPNTHKSGDRTEIYTAGFNWFFAETTKLQLNYNFKAEETNKKNNNEFLAQFQFGF